VPTYAWVSRFRRDFLALSGEEQRAFLASVAEFVEDLDARQAFRSGLRVKGVRRAPGVFEMSWAPDGRATFNYGAEVRPGEPHIVWRRVGSHAIFGDP
jgi:hypothetical protein